MTLLAVDPHNVWQGFDSAGYRVAERASWDFVADGFAFGLWRRAERVWHSGSVIVSQADVYGDGADWLHASIAYTERMPDYHDLAVLHRAVFGRKRWSYQVFAPEAEHINIHSHALHLWGRADGVPALPNFGSQGTI